MTNTDPDPDADRSEQTDKSVAKIVHDSMHRGQTVHYLEPGDTFDVANDDPSGTTVTALRPTAGLDDGNAYCLACGQPIDLQQIAAFMSGPVWAWECDACDRRFEVKIQNQTALMNGDGREDE